MGSSLNDRLRLTGYYKHLFQDEFTKLLRFVMDKVVSPATSMCILVIMFLGLRVSEASALRRGNFNQDFTVLKFYPLKSNPKRLQERSVPKFLSSLLRIYWHAWHRRCRTADCFCVACIRNQEFTQPFLFFPYMNGSRRAHIGAAAVQSQVRKACIALGLVDIYNVREDGKPQNRISPHTFRHFFLYNLTEVNQHDYVEAADEIGHKDIEVTMMYCRGVAKKLKGRNYVEGVAEQLLTGFIPAK